MGKPKMLLPGLIVVANKVNQKKQCSTPFFEIRFAHDTPANPMFFTSPALREELNKSKYTERALIGQIHYAKYNNELFAFNYPFKYAPNEASFEKKGIARGLERIVMRELGNTFGKSMRIIPAFGASQKRARQMERLGVRTTESIGKSFDYDVGLSDLHRRINEARNKYKKEHRLPPQESLARAKKLGLKLRQRRK